MAKGAGANDENPISAFLTSVGRRRFRSIVSQPVRLGDPNRLLRRTLDNRTESDL